MSLLVYRKFDDLVSAIKNDDAYHLYDLNSNQESVYTKTEIGDDIFLITDIFDSIRFNLFLVAHLIVMSKKLDPINKLGKYKIYADVDTSKLFHVNTKWPITSALNKLSSIYHYKDAHVYANALKSIVVLNEADTEILKQFEATLPVADQESFKEDIGKFIPDSRFDVSINSLKSLYDYQCQICGKNVAADYGVNIVEGHHIKPLAESGTSEKHNILILCPNHHSLMHKAIGKLDLTKKEIYYEKTYKRDKLLLYEHLFS